MGSLQRRTRIQSRQRIRPGNELIQNVVVIVRRKRVPRSIRHGPYKASSRRCRRNHTHRMRSGRYLQKIISRLVRGRVKITRRIHTQVVIRRIPHRYLYRRPCSAHQLIHVGLVIAGIKHIAFAIDRRSHRAARTARCKRHRRLRARRKLQYLRRRAVRHPHVTRGINRDSTAIAQTGRNRTQQRHGLVSRQRRIPNASKEAGCNRIAACNQIHRAQARPGSLRCKLNHHRAAIALRHGLPGTRAPGAQREVKPR